jgi:hypothetical protein
MAMNRTHLIDGWLDNELGIKDDGISNNARIRK